MNEIELVARAIDPEAWADDAPIPTRAAVIAFHQNRQKSVERATAAIAAMRGEPVGFRYTKPFHEDVFSWFREPALAGWTETAIYAGPTPPASGKD